MLNLGDIRFGISADTSGLSAAQKMIEGLGSRLDAVFKASKGEIDAATAALVKQEGAALRALAQIQNLQNRIANTKVPKDVQERLSGQANEAFTRFTAAQTASKTPLNMLQSQRETLGLAEELANVNRELADETKLAAEAADMIARMAQESREVSAAMRAQAGSNFGKQLNESFGIGGQVKSAKESAQVFQEAAKAAQAEQEAVARANAEIIAGFERQRLAVMRDAAAVEQLQQQLDKLSRTKVGSALATQLGGRLDSALATRTEEATGKNADPLNAEAMLASSLKFRGALASVRSEISATRAAANPLGAAMRGISDALILSTGPFGMLAFRVRAATDLIKEYGVVVGGTVAGSIGLGIGVVELGSQLLKATIATQQAEASLKAIMGSSELAAGELDYLRATADKAGLSFTQIAPSFSRFEASANATGQSVGVTHDEFTKLSLIMGTLHLQTDQVTNVIRTMDEIFSQGYVQTRNVVRQFATELPGAMDISKVAAAAMTGQLGLTGAAFEKLLSSKQVSGPEFVKAFTDAYAVFLHLDPTKQIDTIYGGFQRLGNASNKLFTDFGTASQATAFFTTALAGLKSLLDTLDANVNNIISTVVELAGALLGAAAAMTALFVISRLEATFMLLVSTIRTLIATFTEFRAAMTLVEIAQMGLTAVFEATPWGALIGILAAVAGAFMGARFAIDSMKEAMAQVAAQSFDDSGFQNYIDQQKTMKDVTHSTNEEMIKQAQIRLTAQQSALSDATTALATLQKQKDDAQKNAADVNRQVGTSISRGASIMRQGANAGLYNPELDKKLKEQTDVVGQLAGQVKIYSQNVKDMQGFESKPENKKVGVGSPGDATKTGRGGSGVEGLSDVMKLHDEILETQAAIKALQNEPFVNPGQLKDLQDATEFMDKFRVLKAKMDDPNEKPENKAAAQKEYAQSLGELAKYLDNITGASLTAKSSLQAFQDVMQGQYKQKREGNEAVTGAQDVIKMIQKAQSEADASAAALKLAQQGKSPDSDNTAGGFKTASEAIDKIIATGPSAAAALKVIAAALGVTSTNADTLKHALADALDEAKNNNDLTKVLETINQSAKQAAQSLTLLKTQNLGQLVNAQELQKAAEAVAALGDDKDQLKALADALHTTDTSVKGVTTAYAAMLHGMDQINEAVKTHESALKESEKVWDAWADGAVDSIYKVIQGTESLQSGLKNILYSLSMSIVENALLDPIKSVLNQGIHNMLYGGGLFGPTGVGGILGGIGGVFGTAVTNPGGAIAGTANAGAATAQTAAQTAATAAITASATATTAQTAAATAQTAVVAELTAAMTALTLAADTAAASLASGAVAGTTTSSFASILQFGTLGAATGGRISGPGSSTSDSIPMMLSDGEFVVNAAATKANLDVLKMINSGAGISVGSRGKMANGGFVGSGYSISPMAAAGSLTTTSSNQTSIDSRAYIDARGATPDAIAGIRQEMMQRDAQLQSKIPYMVDARIIDNRTRGRPASVS